jgi:hypothetical protein
MPGIRGGGVPGLSGAGGGDQREYDKRNDDGHL